MSKNSIIAIVIILGLAVVLVVLGFYYQTYAEGIVPVLSTNFIITSILFVIFIAVVLSLILTRKLLLIDRQEKMMELQQLHLQQIQEMMQIIKSQRHDFANHLQVVYGLLTINEPDLAQEYITNLYQDVQASGETLKLAVSELTALLMVKVGVATGKGISFRIDVQTNLDNLVVKPLDITTVVGNLINNAFEAVGELNESQRIVELKILENSRYYVFQTRNPGYMDSELRTKIFTAGFSTKSGDSERGLGLASARHILSKYRGTSIVVSSQPECGVRFTVCIPKYEGKGMIN